MYGFQEFFFQGLLSYIWNSLNLKSPRHLDSIKIQLIGTFHYYKILDLTPMEFEYFTGIARSMGLLLEEALIDPFFYHKLHLEKTQSYEDLNGITFFGLDTNEFHQIEVFINGIKKQKFKYSDFNIENVLFPLYTSFHSSFIVPKNKYLIKTKEKGSVNYLFKLNQEEKTLFDSIKLEISKTDQETNLVANILFDNFQLSIKRKDTLVTEQFSLFY